MVDLIGPPTRVPAAGTPPKLIDEFVGLTTGTSQVSVAMMQSPAGWSEPGQRPEFDEYTVVLEGSVVVAHEHGSVTVEAGQAVVAHAGEWVRYATPDGARYVSVCVPGFTPDSVHRDDQ